MKFYQTICGLKFELSGKDRYHHKNDNFELNIYCDNGYYCCYSSGKSITHSMNENIEKAISDSLSQIKTMNEYSNEKLLKIVNENNQIIEFINSLKESK